MKLEDKIRLKIDLGEMLFKTIDLASKGFVPKDQLLHLDFLQGVLEEMLRDLSDPITNNNEGISTDENIDVC